MFKYDQAMLQAQQEATEAMAGDGRESVYINTPPRYENPGRKSGPIPYEIRLLPSKLLVDAFMAGDLGTVTPEMAQWWVAAAYHGKNTMSKQEKNLLCIHETIYMGKPIGEGRCALCECRKAEQSKPRRSQEDEAFIRKMTPRTKFFTNGYLVGEDDERIGIIVFPVSVWEKLREKDLNSKWGPITDPESGRSFELTDTENGNFWEYEIQMSPDRSAVSVHDWENKLIDIPGHIFRNPPTYEQTMRLLQGEDGKKVFERPRVDLTANDVDVRAMQMAKTLFSSPVGKAVSEDLTRLRKPTTKPPVEEEEEEEEPTPVKKTVSIKKKPKKFGF